MIATEAAAAALDGTRGIGTKGKAEMKSRQSRRSPDSVFALCPTPLALAAGTPESSTYLPAFREVDMPLEPTNRRSRCGRRIKHKQVSWVAAGGERRLSTDSRSPIAEAVTHSPSNLASRERRGTPSSRPSFQSAERRTAKGVSLAPSLLLLRPRRSTDVRTQLSVFSGATQ